MTLLQKAASRLLAYVGIMPASGTLSGARMYDTFVGRAITEESALGTAAVWSAVRLLAEVGGSLPVHFFRRNPDNSTDRTRYKLDYVIGQEPNQFMSAVEFWESTVASLATWGNSYAVITRNAIGDVVSLMPLNPSRVVVRLLDGRIDYQVASVNGVLAYQPADILHIKLFSFDGLIGLSPIGVCRQALGLAVAAEEYGARFYANNATPAGFVSPTEPMTPVQVDAFKTRFNTANQGLENSHKIDILPVGFKWQQITIPPEDSQFIESRKFSIEEIARIFRVPPHLIMDLSHATFSNIESQGMSFVQFCLLPYLRKIEAAIERALIEQKDKGVIFPEFNVDGLMRGDSAARSAYYSQMTQNGIMTRNECRRLERLSPIKGGDDLTVQVNLTPLHQLGKTTGQATHVN